MAVIDELLENNASYAASFDKGDLPLPPGRGLAVLACMDARLDTPTPCWASAKATRTSSATPAAS